MRHERSSVDSAHAIWSSRAGWSRKPDCSNWPVMIVRSSMVRSSTSPQSCAAMSAIRRSRRGAGAASTLSIVKPKRRIGVTCYTLRLAAAHFKRSAASARDDVPVRTLSPAHREKSVWQAPPSTLAARTSFGRHFLAPAASMFPTHGTSLRRQVGSSPSRLLTSQNIEPLTRLRSWSVAPVRPGRPVGKEGARRIGSRRSMEPGTRTTGDLVRNRRRRKRGPPNRHIAGAVTSRRLHQDAWRNAGLPRPAAPSGEAEQLYRKVLDGRRAALGENNPAPTVIWRSTSRPSANMLKQKRIIARPWRSNAPCSTMAVPKARRSSGI